MGALADSFKAIFIDRSVVESEDAFESMFHKVLWVRYVASLTPSLQRQAAGANGLLAISLFKAWYNSVYTKPDNYGGVHWVSSNEVLLRLLAHLVSAFYGLRERSPRIRSASAECPSMRNTNGAPVYIQDSLYVDLPFAGMMAWDISSIKGSCNMSESHFFSTVHPARWGLSTSKGEDRSLEDTSIEVFDITAAISKGSKKVKT